MRLFILLPVFILLGTASYAQIGGMNSNMNGMNMMSGMGGRGGNNGKHSKQRGSDAPVQSSSEVYMIVDKAPGFPR